MPVAVPILTAPDAAAAAAALHRAAVAGVLVYALWGVGLVLLLRLDVCGRIAAACARRFGRLGELLACFGALACVLALGGLAQACGLLVAPDPSRQPGALVAGLAPEILLGGPVLYGALLLLRRAGRRGWIWCGALAALGVFAFEAEGPLVLSGGVSGQHPAAASPRTQAFLEFARRGGVHPGALYVQAGADPLKVDAEGALGAVHLAVSQGALANPRPETFAALGHLLGHLAHWDYVGFGGLLAGEVLALVVALTYAPGLLGRRLLGPASPPPSSPASLPVMALVVWAFFPVGRLGYNLFDQAINYRADAYAVALTGDRAALARWVASGDGAQPPDPGPFETLFFYDHPPLKPRLAQISRDRGPAFNPVFAAGP